MYRLKKRADSTIDMKVLGPSNPVQVPKAEVEQYWSAFKTGDEKAFIAIYQHFFPVLFNYGCQFATDRGLVKDCIQDLFIEMRKRRQGLCDIDYSLKYYLFKSLRRKIFRTQSKYSRIIRASLYEESSFKIALSHETKLINGQMEESQRHRLQAAVGRLTPRQKELILLRFYEDLSYKEIASIMDFSKVEYVRILMHRAIKKLRKEMVPADS